MRSVSKIVFCLFLVTAALDTQSSHQRRVLDGFLDFLRDQPIVQWLLSLISDFGEPLQEKHVVKIKRMVPPSTQQLPPPAFKPSKQQVVKKVQDKLEKFHLGDKLHGMWEELRTCHQNCADDAECHHKCPKPWELRLKKCQEHKAVADCHKACHHDHGCHQACPLPSCPHKAQHVKEAMDCHDKCIAQEAGFPCHRACPKPFQHMEHNCEDLETMVACHEACKPGERECHRACFKSSPFHHGPGGWRHHHHDDNSEGHGWGHHGWWHQHEGEDQQEGRGPGHHGMWHHHGEGGGDGGAWGQRGMWHHHSEGGDDKHHGGWHHQHGDSEGEQDHPWHRHHHHWHGPHQDGYAREQVVARRNADAFV